MSNPGGSPHVPSTLVYPIPERPALSMRSGLATCHRRVGGNLSYRRRRKGKKRACIDIFLRPLFFCVLWKAMVVAVSRLQGVIFLKLHPNN